MLFLFSLNISNQTNDQLDVNNAELKKKCVTVNLMIQLFFMVVLALKAIRENS